MTDGVNPDVGDDAFVDIDAKLTVFALANGMDLSKGPDYRQLEWFTEGLERAILIRSVDPGRFDLTVMSWPTGRVDERQESSSGDGVSVDALSEALGSAIDAANDLGARS